MSKKQDIIERIQELQQELSKQQIEDQLEARDREAKGNNYQYKEDGRYSHGDYGNLALFVRNDTGATLCSQNFDYSPCAVDRRGFLRVELPNEVNELLEIAKKILSLLEKQ